MELTEEQCNELFYLLSEAKQAVEGASAIALSPLRNFGQAANWNRQQTEARLSALYVYLAHLMAGEH